MLGTSVKRERERKRGDLKHLSVHQWIRSAIPDSQQPISPIGFLFLKLPPPPCAVLLVILILITWYQHVIHVEKYETWNVTDRHAYRMELYTSQETFHERWKRITSSTMTSHETGKLMLSQSTKSHRQSYKRLIFWAHKNPPSTNHRSFRKLEIFQPVVAVTASCAKVWLNYSVDSHNLILLGRLRSCFRGRTEAARRIQNVV